MFSGVIENKELIYNKLLEFVTVVRLALAYGPYHSPTLGDNVATTVNVTNVAANGQLGFDDDTIQTAPPPHPTNVSQFTVFAVVLSTISVRFLVTS